MSILRDSSILQASSLLRAGASVGTALVLTRALGATEQGRYYIAAALFGVVTLVFATGVNTIGVSRQAHAGSKGDEETRRAWFGFAVLAHGGMALAIGLCGVALPLVAPRFGFEDREVITWAMALCWTPTIELLRAVTGLQLQAGRRMVRLAGLETCTELTRSFLVVCGAVATGSIEGAVIGWIASSLLSIPLAWQAARTEPGAFPVTGLADVWTCVQRAPLRQGIRQGLLLGPTRNAGHFVIEVLPALAMARFGGEAAVAYLRIAQRIAKAAAMFANGVSRTALPAFSARVGNHVAFRRTWIRTTLFSGGLVGSIWAAMLVSLPLVLSVLVPLDYRAPVTRLCFALTPCVMALAFASVAEAFYIATGTLRVSAWITLAVTPLGVAAILVGGYLDPEVGVAWGLSFAAAGEFGHLVYSWRWLQRRQPEVTPTQAR